LALPAQFKAVEHIGSLDNSKTKVIVVHQPASRFGFRPVQAALGSVSRSKISMSRTRGPRRAEGEFNVTS
jgi:hypothetical protein